jgi:ATP-dependent Clp protease ATP-binding subunit ClpB
MVNFKNTIIIMTSNTGSHIIQENYERMRAGEELATFEGTKYEVMDLLRKQLRPEFLNRVDEIIMFTPLTRSQIKDIVKLQLARLSERLQHAGVRMAASEEAMAYLADSGYDPQFGARPVKRVIQKEVLNELSKALLRNTIDKTNQVVLDVFDGKIVFRKQLEKEKVIEFMN